jgi:toxin-antitoxin system PIN domain toxin
MTDLLDVNVWLALADSDHTHHGVACTYWMEQEASEVAFCRVSMMGFLLLITHAKVLSNPPSIRQAWTLYHQYRSNPHVVFLEEPPDFEACLQKLASGPFFAHRLWTDAQLAALAITSGCRLVSFDADFQMFEGLNFRHLALT